MAVELGFYRHYKGNCYQVIAIGKFTEMIAGSDALLDVVVYKALYGSTEYGYGAIWVRPIAIFEQDVTVNGSKVPRFARITEEEASVRVEKV
jgi:hypothetical protein